MKSLSPLPFRQTKLLPVFLLACAGVAAVIHPGTLVAGQAGVVATISNFPGSNEEGSVDGLPPVTAPIKATDGNIYGISPYGGTYGNGFVFKISASGVYSVLHTFHDDEFSDPLVEEGDEPRVLIEGRDGYLYGICNDGGLNDDQVYHNGGGTLFKIAFNGAFVKLYDFDHGDPNTTLGNPVALVEGSDGYYYGLTNAGGANFDGGFFRFNVTNRACVTLHSFNNTDTIGFEPQAQLLLAKDGNFYGTTTGGGGNDAGTEGYGTIFRINTAGTPTLVHAFVPDTDDPSVITPKPDSNPLIQGIDLALYGMSTMGRRRRR